MICYSLVTVIIYLKSLKVTTTLLKFVSPLEINILLEDKIFSIKLKISAFCRYPEDDNTSPLKLETHFP